MGTDLKDFHLFSKPDKDGNQTAKDVFDSKIVEYLIDHMDLMIYNNILYIYVGGVYVKDKDGRKIKSQIQALMYDEFKTAIRINRVYALLMCTNSLVVTEEETNTYPAHWINFKNGMLDVISGKLKEHSPAYHSMNQIPHDYIVSEHEKELTFCKFLESRMNEDDRQMLYEFFALCLNVDMSFQKMMYIVGIGEVGKSLVLEYINHIVGRENVSHISPQNLSQRFQSAFLMHKLLNSVSDISSKAIRESSVIKQLSGEDAIPAEYKGGDVFSFYNTSKMLFSANTVPLVEDEQSNGYYRRLLIARMKQGNYIPNLKENIKKESPEFIYFLTKHLKNVYERGAILESQGSKGEVSMLRNISDSVQEFVDEVITECQGMNPKKRDVFNYYEKYCIAEKLESVGRNTFYQSMASKGLISGKSNGVEVFRNISISTSRIFLNYKGVACIMSKVNLNRTEYQGAPRLGFDAYNMSRERYIELRNGCAVGKYSPETLSKACIGLEFIKPWIILSVTKSMSFDRMEFDFKLGRIPVGRSDFYGFRRKFYHNLDVLLNQGQG